MQEQHDTLLKQLLIDPKFRLWVSGEAPEYDQYWHNWSKISAEHEMVLQRGYEILNELREDFPSFSEEYITDKVEEALFAAKSIEKENSKTTFSTFFVNYRSLAASILLLAFFSVIAILYLRPFETKEDLAKSGISHENLVNKVINTDKKPRHILLPDGSSVLLQSLAEISFPDQFQTHQREVSLKGDAFFEVIKNPSAPFIVYAGDIKTQVLGTSFRIKTDITHANVLVSVKSGKVAVYTQSDLKDQPPQKILLPNQRAIFFTTTEQSVQAPEYSPEPDIADIPIQTLSFSYDKMPVTEVLKDLVKAYGVDIVFNHAELQYCSITAQLDDEPLMQKLKWICTILEATYTIENNKIIIHSKPCNT